MTVTTTQQESIGIAGIGVALAENRVDPWKEIGPAADMDEAKLRDYLGCYQLPIAEPHESPSHFAVLAARQAVAEAGIDVAEIDVVISNNISSDFLDWQLSGCVAHSLGIDAATTFDIYAGCNSTGIAYETALTMIRADESVDVVLIALSEHLGGGTFPQFIGDGACAWIVRRGCGDLVAIDHLNINKAMPRLGVLPEGGVVNPFTSETRFDGQWQDNVEFNVDEFRRTFRPLMIPLCASSYIELCQRRGMGPNDVDHLFIVHQQREFNRRLVEHIGVDESKTPLDYIEDTGHISGFDVMIDMKRAIVEGRVAKGDLIGLIIVGQGELHTFLLEH